MPGNQRQPLGNETTQLSTPSVKFGQYPIQPVPPMIEGGNGGQRTKMPHPKPILDG
jgi:hypothetical protein